MYPPHHPSQSQINHSSVPPSQQYQSHMDHQTSSVPQIAYHSPQASTQPMTKVPQMDSGFAVPLFSQGDDPIACLNKEMAFLTAATIQDDRITVQQVLGRQGQRYDGTGYKGNATSYGGNNTRGQEKHMKLDKFLDEEQLAFLADPSIPDGQAAQTTISNNAAFQTEDLDVYDSDCDDVSNAKAVLMANLSNYGSDVISEDFKQTPAVDFSNNEIHSDSNIIPYSQYLKETQQEAIQDTNLYAQQDSMILSVIEQMSEQMINHVNNWEKSNQEKNNESLTTEIER
ncbi:hypothetical protein Tco_0794042 [Tanacetum coccineum]